MIETFKYMHVYTYIGMGLCLLLESLPREVLNVLVAAVLWLSVAILIWLHPAFWEAKD